MPHHFKITKYFSFNRIVGKIGGASGFLQKK